MMLNPCRKCLVIMKCNENDECKFFDNFEHFLEKFASVGSILFIIIKLFLLTKFFILLKDYSFEYSKILCSVIAVIGPSAIHLTSIWILYKFGYGKDNIDYNKKNASVFFTLILIFIFPEALLLSLMVISLYVLLQRPYAKGKELKLWELDS